MPTKNRKTKAVDELRPEYDMLSLKGGVRGKYFAAATAGSAAQKAAVNGAGKRTMNSPGRQKLETKGWRSGSAADFLGLCPEERQLVEVKWRTEARRRVAHVREGRVKSIPAAEVRRRVRQATILPRVIEAKHDGRFRIRLVFADNTTKTVDFRPWLNGPVFEPLKDVKYFQRFLIDGGTVAWPNGADIAPEALYEAEDVASVASKPEAPSRKVGRLGVTPR